MVVLLKVVILIAGAYMNETIAYSKVIEFKENGEVTSNKRFV